MSAGFSFAASRRAVLATAALAFAASLSVPAMAEDGAKKNLLIGATAGSNYDLLQKGIVPQLQKKGYKIELIQTKSTTYESSRHSDAIDPLRSA